MRPISKLFVSPLALSGCLFAAIYRDTRGTALCGADRFNHFPASPLASVTLVRKGTLHLLSKDASWPKTKALPPLPRIFSMAPQDTPVTSWSHADIEAVTIGVYPDAWHQLGGDAAFEKVPPDIAVALECFAAGKDPESGWQAFCSSLDPAWQKAKANGFPAAAGIADWAKGLIARSALSGPGRSLRSLERRIKRSSGQTRQMLGFYAAFENLQRVFLENRGSSLAEIAAEAGYCDQSHMGRAVQRATGFSPARLNRAIETEEAFWCYRLLGERF